jgi:hypothetical protein
MRAALSGFALPISYPGRERQRPIFSFRCPVHGSLVGLNGAGQLVTLCPRCVAEASAEERLNLDGGTRVGYRLRPIDAPAEAA